MKHQLYKILKIRDKIFRDYSLSRTIRPFFILLLLFSLSFNVYSQNTLVPFTFKLTVSAKTSAGVYKKDGTLIRTLWSGVNLAAGNHTKTWDRKDNEGLLVADTGLIVKVLSNNVNYQWEGVIGNTSDSSHGASVFRSYYRMESMAIYGNTAYFATGYGEGGTSSSKFFLNKPQQKVSIMFHHYGCNLDINYVATDGKYVYWAGFDPNGGQYTSTSLVSLTYATQVSNDNEVLLSSGIPVRMGTGITYQKAIDVILNNAAANPTGLAVQKQGKYLFVAHGGINKINILNKSTGAAVTSVSFTNPREVCVDGNDNLWVIHGTNTVEKFTVDSTNGTLSSSAILSLSGLLAPLSLAVSPNNYQIVVLDGGASQQVKSFSNASGVALWTYGQYGGYETDPTVTDDKFYFTDTFSGMKKQFIAFQPDSSFWVSDGGNERVQHYSASRNFIDYNMYMPCTYSTQVDRNDPTRAFNNFLEFKIDYSKPLGPNNGSWKLHKNWRHGLTSAHYTKENYNVFNDVITLSNGRTYATVYNNSNINARYPEVVELPATGNIRFTGVKFAAFSNEIIDTDGTRRAFRHNNVDSGRWESRTLTGFSGNNPTWASTVKIAAVNVLNKQDPSYDPTVGDLSFARKTSSDILVLFNRSLREGYHLGGVRVGDNKFLWKTAMTTFTESSANAGDAYQGEYPNDGSYDLGNGVRVGGGHVYTLEKNIFWNYHGEFWGGSQTNKWSHVYDNGLLVSTFGITLPEGKQIDWEAAAACAGNVFSSTVVKVGNDYYIYHNDESVHSAMHRWKITGLNTIAEQVIPISSTVATGGLTATYFDGMDLNNSNRKVSQVDATVDLSSPPKQITNQSSFSTRWTGFIQPVYSQNYTFYCKVNKGVKLWINDKPTINQWKNASATEFSTTAINLEAGKRYQVRMEINGGTAQLLWSSSSQSKQIIPSINLFPVDFPLDANDGIDLMEGLPYRSVLEDGMYGWNRNAALEDNTSGTQNWHVQTNMRSFEKDNPDVLMRFRSNTNNYSVTRDLGKVVPCLTSWTINGKISYMGNDPNNFNFGGSIDVLDNAGKIICKIVNQRKWDGNGNPTQVKCNGTAIIDLPSNLMFLILNKMQTFEISTDISGVTFKYADYQPIKVALFDASSNWKQPASLKFNFTSSTYYPNYDVAVAIKDLRFFTVAPALPEVTAAGATKFCQGDSVTLTSSLASSYLWNNNATTQSITVKNAGNYNVEVKDANGCPLPSDSINVEVNQLPIASITANAPTTFCQGDSVILTAGTAATYQWSNNANTSSIKIETNEQITLTVSDMIGCKSQPSAPIQVNVNPLPIAPSISTDKLTTFCMGDTVTLTSTPASSYLWSNNLTTQSIKVLSTGDYFVSIKDSNACSNISPLIHLKANIIPTTVITPSGPTSFCTGESVRLTASPSVTYLWSTNETTQSIIVDATQDVMVITKDVNECYSVSSTTSVQVSPLPEIPSITVNGEILRSSSIAGNQWYYNDIAIQGATNQFHTATKNGKYRVEVSDGNNCRSVSDALNFNALNIAYQAVKNFSIFPNPNNGLFEISANGNTDGQIKIYDILGDLVYTSDLKKNTIDMTIAPKGIYLVELIIADHKMTKKIAIQ